jgi:hypothetical protein
MKTLFIAGGTLVAVTGFAVNANPFILGSLPGSVQSSFLAPAGTWVIDNGLLLGFIGLLLVLLGVFVKF